MHGGPTVLLKQLELPPDAAASAANTIVRSSSLQNDPQSSDAHPSQQLGVRRALAQHKRRPITRAVRFDVQRQCARAGTSPYVFLTEKRLLNLFLSAARRRRS